MHSTSLSALLVNKIHGMQIFVGGKRDQELVQLLNLGFIECSLAKHFRQCYFVYHYNSELMEIFTSPIIIKFEVFVQWPTREPHLITGSIYVYVHLA